MADRVEVSHLTEPSAYIYALVCPLTGHIRYVGQTKDVSKRYKQHTYNAVAGNPTKREWLQVLRDRGVAPELVVLETVRYTQQHDHPILWEASEAPCVVEQRWIEKLRGAGVPLVNIYPDALLGG